MNWTDAQYRYSNDAAFRAVVDMMEQAIHQMHLTPGEVRDAAMLAALRFEERALPERYYKIGSEP